MRRRGGRSDAGGFTLVEMLVVMAVISIIVSLVMKALGGAYRAAESKATIALIAKLETALTDRVQALLMVNSVPTWAHIQLATSVYSSSGISQPATARAQVIANYDDFRANLPDVFLVQNYNPSGNDYPLNFAAMPFGTSGTASDYLLPIGANASGSGVVIPSTGIYGASYSAAAAVYEQLGYGAKGLDSSDNDGDGYIDEWDEGIAGLIPGQIQLIQQRLKAHKHSTARAEMLYAMLVNNMGPFGSAFAKDDFLAREIADTDGDGLLEFVDAWGQPLQFYRWPIAYHSDQQRGFPSLDKITQDLALGVTPGPFTASASGSSTFSYEARDVNSLDPNQQLLSPSWFNTDSSRPNLAPSWAAGLASPPVSAAAMAFQQHFHTLVDPIAVTAGKASPTFWDRAAKAAPSGAYGTTYLRRAYYCRFLVISGGQDKMPGVAMLSQYPGDSRGYPWSVDYRQLDERSQIRIPGGTSVSIGTRDSSGAPVALSITNLIQIENQGSMIDPNRTGPFYAPTFGSNWRNDTNTLLEYFGADDITTQNFTNLGVPQ